MAEKLKRWVNICKVSGTVQYKDDYIYTAGGLYDTKDEAMGYKAANQIACIEIEFEEGEGL